MKDTLVNELFTAVIGDPPPAEFDVERAVRLGRRRRRARVSGSAATTLVLIGFAALLAPALYRGSQTQTPVAVSSASSQGSPTGFPYGGAAQVHSLPNANYAPPADLVAVRLPDPAPGFPYRVQPDGMYAMTVGAGTACYGSQFAVSTARPGMSGSSATVLVTNCAPPAIAEGAVEGHPIVAHRAVAGADGVLTEYTSDTAGSTNPNRVLYFTTGHFTTRIEGTGLTEQQLIDLGDALTGLR